MCLALLPIIRAKHVLTIADNIISSMIFAQFTTSETLTKRLYFFILESSSFVLLF